MEESLCVSFEEDDGKKSSSPVTHKAQRTPVARCKTDRVASLSSAGELVELRPSTCHQHVFFPFFLLIGMFSRVNGFHLSELLQLGVKLLFFHSLEERKGGKKTTRALGERRQRECNLGTGPSVRIRWLP